MERYCCIVAWTVSEWHDLSFVEAELLDIGEVLPDSWVDFVGVECIALDARDQ